MTSDRAIFTRESAAGPTSRGAACSIPRACRTRANSLTPAEHLTSIEINGTFYRTQTPGDVPQMGLRSAGRICFFAQGSALRGQPPRAGGGRRLDQALSQFRHHRTGPPPRPPALAIRAAQEIRRSRFRQIPRIAAGQIRRPHAAPCRRSAARQLQDAGLHRAAAQVRRCRRLSPSTTPIPSIADVTGDFVYARLQKGDEKLKAGYPPKALDAWASARKPGRKAASRRICRVSTRSTRRKQPRDVFRLFHPRSEVRAPAAAMALIERLK